MVNRMQFYIDGAWVDPAVKKSTPVVNPATEEAMYEVALGSKADVDKAVAAARRAFETFSQTSREERVALLTKIVEVYKTRMKDIGAAVSDEMGAPLPMAEKLQAGAGLGHIMSTLDVLKNYHFEETLGSAVVVREPVGVDRHDHAVELAAEPDRLQGCPRARRRLHHDPEAVGIHAVFGLDLRGNPARGRRAEGRVQPHQRPRP